jgi:hypothetical protein
MRRSVLLVCVVLVAGASTAAWSAPAGASGRTEISPGLRPFPGGHLVRRMGVTVRDGRLLSGGALMWFRPPRPSGEEPGSRAASITYGSNVDANDPTHDLMPGQAETAIAASGDNVMTAWNDASSFLTSESTKRVGSGTGVGFSDDGGVHFRDLIGLRNNRRPQQWAGDPTVVAIDATHFIVGSLYLPRTGASCRRDAPFRLQIAVEVASVQLNGTVALTNPIIAADGGLACRNSSFLDKPFLAFDPASRTLALSYTRFSPVHCGTGQIEVLRAHVPADPTTLHTFTRLVVAPEFPCRAQTVLQGSYPAVAPGGDVYVAYEQNVLSNLSNGNPYVRIKLARIAAGTPHPSATVVVTRGQVNSGKVGGVKSLDAVNVVGYNRTIGQDFPRIAFSPVEDSAIVEWNDASVDPLGDIWLRAVSHDLSSMGSIQKVNDDSGFALQFLPAVSVRSDGTICSSWYDRRLHPSASALTDTFAECRASSGVNGLDTEISTGSSDWFATSTLVSPNFGDYTDNASTGTTTFYTWTDGRTGFPQPFVDSN